MVSPSLQEFWVSVSPPLQNVFFCDSREKIMWNKSYCTRQKATDKLILTQAHQLVSVILDHNNWECMKHVLVPISADKRFSPTSDVSKINIYNKCWMERQVGRKLCI